MDAKLTIVDVTGSTNDDLLEAGKQGAPHGTGLAARAQTAGRGRRGHKWDSTAGNLLLSIVLRPCVNPAKCSGLAAVSGLAVLEALEKQGLANEIGLKWPNDLVGRQADGSFKKLAGILCESRSGERSFAVCGIGINLCQPASFFEQAGLPDAGSVAQVFYCVPDAYQLLEEIGVHLQNWLLVLKSGPKQLLDAYSSRCITLGRQVCICREGQMPIEAKAIRIDSDGQLVCLTQKEEVKVRAGEVSVRGLYGYVE